MGASTPTIGRDRELAGLREALASAADGRGRFVLLSGEAGIGKTQLAREIAREAEARGLAVHWGRCWEGGDAPAYWPWSQILRALARANRNLGGAASSIPEAAILAELAPELRAGGVKGARGRSAPAEPPRSQLHEAFASILRASSDARPLALLIEDLHAADPSSLDLLRWIASELDDSSILLLGTRRTEDPGLDVERASALSRLTRMATTFSLGGLARDDVGRLIAAVTGSNGDERLVEDIHRATGGNPLFVEGLAQMLGEAASRGEPRRTRVDPRRLPLEVRQVLTARIALLSTGTRQVLAIASILGREFSLRLLVALAELPEGDVLDALSEAVGAGIVCTAESGVDRYEFLHGLVREAIYSEQPLAERSAMHERAAVVVARLIPADSPERTALLAHHYGEAARGGRARERAAAAVEAAARRAAAVFAHEEAIAGYERAVALAELGGCDDDRRCELLIALAESRVRAGDSKGGLEDAQRAAGLARELGRAELFARAVLTLGTSSWAPAGADPLVVALIDEALEIVGPGESILRARLLAQLAGTVAWSVRGRRSLELGAEALEIARRVNDQDALAAALVARHLDLGGPENLPDRISASSEAVSASDGLRHPDVALLARFWHLADLFELGDLPAVEVHARWLDRSAEEIRQPIARWIAIVIGATRAHFEGRFDAAERLAEEALRAGETIQPETIGQYYAIHCFALRREQGRLHEMEPIVRAIVVDRPTIPGYRCGLAYLYVEQGDLGQARREYEILAPNGFAAIPRDAAWLSASVLIAPVAVALGDEDGMRLLYERILPYERINVAAARGGPSHGFGAHVLGLLAAGLGRLDDAERHFQTAIDLADRLGARGFLARSRIEYGRALLSLGGPAERERAAALLAEGRKGAAALGMAGDVRRAAVETDVEKPASVARPEADTSSGQSARSALLREGDFWTVRYESRTIRIRDLKGLRYLALLLRSPGNELNVLDLVDAVDGAEAANAARAGGVETLDPRARRELRRRATELLAEAEEARAADDGARVARAEAEIEAITEELTRALGLGGRARETGSIAERARLNVTRAIHAALRRIREEDRELGEHLRRTVRTGFVCSYKPDPRLPIIWET